MWARGARGSSARQLSGPLCWGWACLRVICFFFKAEDGIRDDLVTGVQTCALPIYPVWSNLKAVENKQVYEVKNVDTRIGFIYLFVFNRLQVAPDRIVRQLFGEGLSCCQGCDEQHIGINGQYFFQRVWYRTWLVITSCWSAWTRRGPWIVCGLCEQAAEEGSRSENIEVDIRAIHPECRFVFG